MKYLLSFLLLFSCKKDDIQIKRVYAVDGNSIPAGYLLPEGYPQMLADTLHTTVYSCAIGGQTTLQMINYSSDVDSLKYDVLIVDEITNDLYFGASVDSAYARVVRYCKGRKALIVFPTPRSNGGTPVDFEAKRQALRLRMISDFVKRDTLVYLRSSYALGMVDLASDSLIGAAGAEMNTLYYQDKVHHTPLGERYRLKQIIKGLQAL